MKEIPLSLLLKTVTAKRLWNAGLATAAFLVSAIRKQNYVWGEPFHLSVEPTNLCNLKCPLCATGNGKMTRQTGVMDFDTFKAIIDRTGDKLFYLLLYQQGEPYINRDFIRFIEYAKEKRIFVTTSSNGHYLSPEIADQTVASGLDSIIISIDGADQETYAAYRVAGDLEKVKQGITNLVQAKLARKSKTPHVILQFIVMRQNEHQVAEMAELAKQLGVNKFVQKTVQVETPEEAKSWLPKQEDLRRYRESPEGLVPKRKGNGPCTRPWMSSLINWQGSVVPCCFDKNADYSFGQIAKTDFAAIWETEAYGNFRTKMLRDRGSIDICSNCSQGLRLFI